MLTIYGVDAHMGQRIVHRLGKLSFLLVSYVFRLRSVLTKFRISRKFFFLASMFCVKLVRT